MEIDLAAAFFLDHETPVAEGVHAVVIDAPDRLTVIWVRAQHPGTGAVSAWLDTIPTTRSVAFVNPSTTLAPMLERRGFEPRMVLTPSADLWVPAHVRSATRTEERTG